jgi:hypothetical protein
MPFETFKRQRAPVTEDPTVTIQKRGTMSLNLAAYRALGEPDAVELLWDRDERLMALRKVDGDTPHAYALRALAKSNTTWLLSGTAFVNYYGIETDAARRYVASTTDDMLVLDLKEPGLLVTSNRDRASARDRQGSLGVS